MKLFVVSDIHGSEYYAEILKNKFEESKCDYLVILGDILYHGPRNPLPKGYNPKGVIKILDEYKDKIIAVRGNCDAYVDDMVLSFPIVENAFILFNNRRIYLTHGHVYNIDNMPNLVKGDIMLYGHFHIPFIKEVNGVVVANPSSISLPKENNVETYMIIDDEIKIIDLFDHVLFSYKL